MKAAKIIIKDTSNTQFILKKDQTSWTFGRSNQCTFPLTQDQKLSRIHCMIHLNEGTYTIKDCQSKNGTFLNNEKVTEEIPISHQACIRIGATEMIFEIVESPVDDTPEIDQPLNRLKTSMNTDTIFTNEETISTNTEPIPPDKNGAIVIPGYQIIKEIGRGAMGSVLQAWDLSKKCMVALKVLNQDCRNNVKIVIRFFKEAQILSNSLKHPNIVHSSSWGQHANYIYMVMEYIEGKDLSTIIKEQGKIPLKRSMEIALETTAAIEHAHEHDIIHRDLKPSNILIDKTGSVKLIDFGLAKMVEKHGLTLSRQVLGTPYYMALEQINCSKHIDHRVDIYAMGAILYQMLCGQSPYEFLHDNNLMTLFAYISGNPPKPLNTLVTLPKSVLHVVEKAMARDIEKRYPSAKELHSAIYDELKRLEPDYAS